MPLLSLLGALDITLFSRLFATYCEHFRYYLHYFLGRNLENRIQVHKYLRSSMSYFTFIYIIILKCSDIFVLPYHHNAYLNKNILRCCKESRFKLGTASALTEAYLLDKREKVKIFITYIKLFTSSVTINHY